MFCDKFLARFFGTALACSSNEWLFLFFFSSAAFFSLCLGGSKSSRLACVSGAVRSAGGRVPDLLAPGEPAAAARRAMTGTVGMGMGDPLNISGHQIGALLETT